MKPGKAVGAQQNLEGVSLAQPMLAGEELSSEIGPEGTNTIRNYYAVEFRKVSINHDELNMGSWAVPG